MPQVFKVGSYWVYFWSKFPHSVISASDFSIAS